MRAVAALVFPGFELLDLFGPLEFFGLIEGAFRIELVAEAPGPVASAQGPEAVAARGIDEARGEILLVPGGPGARREVANARLLEGVAAFSAQAELTLGVCTGAALLARAGLLDGRRATTNKAAFGWVAAQGPKVDWVKRARWVEDGPFLTSAGVSAGMDMALAAIARLEGAAAAEAAARAAEYRWSRAPEDDPFAAAFGLAP